jgi:hypothetical protein
MPHDAGGKVKLPLLPGWKGNALYSGDNKEYRTALLRYREEGLVPFILWIGMNPSTAEEDVDDPTIRRELTFSIREGYSRYVKCNVMDYRSTDPKLLPTLDKPVSDYNLMWIDTLAVDANKIVLCYGKLHKSLAKHAFKVLEVLNPYMEKVVCLGRNSDGSPKHPLYLASTTEFVSFR